MTEQMLAIRKIAIRNRKNWGYQGLNPQPIDRAGQVVSVAWNRVVEVTDGGTITQVEAAIADAEAAEAAFRQRRME